MAGRGIPVGNQPFRILSAARGIRGLPGGAAVAAAVFMLAACTRESAAPALGPAPTFVVATATPGPPAVPTPGVEQRYVVREGDTISGIAARFGVPEDAILKANGITDPDRLFAGQELVIPAPQP